MTTSGKNDSYKLLRQLSVDHAQQVLQLYKEAWWADTRTLQGTIKILAGSSFTCGFSDDSDNLMAFGRVVSDGIEKATIYDIIVREEVQGHGLGRRIMETLMASDVCTNANHVELYCKEEMRPFYQKLGFSDITDQVKLLRLVK